MPTPCIRLPGVRPAAKHRRRSDHRLARRLVGLTALMAATGVVAPLTLTGPVSAGQNSRPIIFGASGTVDELSRNVGASLAVHAYGKLSGGVPRGALVNMKPTVNWRTVASARAGSSVYSDIARWADTLKSRGGMTMFIFHHEPEVHPLGSPQEFIDAYRRVVTIFRERGVRNVEYTWNMTANAFRVSPGDRRYAGRYYPGDAYVDNVASDPYNWYDCGEGRGKWRSLNEVAGASLAFARSHGKSLVLAEWGSQSGPRRAQWLRDARDWFVANSSTIRAVFYFQTPLSRQRPGCRWRLASSEDLRAFGEMARDGSRFSG